jgi:hypothetical protein
MQLGTKFDYHMIQSSFPPCEPWQPKARPTGRNGFGSWMSQHKIGTWRNAARDHTFPHIPEEQVMDGSGTTVRFDRAALSQSGSTATAADTRKVDPLSVTKRLQRDGRWTEVEPVRNRLIKECRKKGMSKPDAQAWTYSELDRLYPPLEPERTAGSGSQFGAAEGGLVTGLSDIPVSWGKLPPNASLASDIQWVQASRIDVVEETASGTIVHLNRADRPAPSKAALGWLETSIRAYSKYCDIAAKATAAYEDEQEVVRRERLSIERVRQLLSEMVD